MDVSQYLEIFIEETKEHLQTLNEQLLVLEKEPDNSDTISEIFRAAHSLKGMAGTMGYKKMQRLTHEMENVFSEIRNGKLHANAELVDILFKGLDALSGYLDNIVNTADEGNEGNEEIADQLVKFVNGGSTGAAETKKKEEKKATADAAVETQQEEKKETVYEEKYKALKIAEHEQKAMEKAAEMGKHVIGATVYIQDTCLLKAARAFLVFKSIEDLGDVIKSNPEIQDIEDEHFDLDFSLIMITSESVDKIKQCMMNVSEIANVVIGEMEVTASEEKTSEEPVKSNDEPVKAAAQKDNVKAPQRAQQQATKPIVNRSVRVDIEKLDNLMNSVSELIIAKNGLVSISSNGEIKNQPGFNDQIEYLERITTELHHSVMKVRMVPIESVINRFPRMIRDLNKSLNKKMELYITGEDTELDRTVIDEIGDPLMHLLRNSADHGLESNEVRLAAGKPEVGSINLDAFQEGNNVVIRVSDDGAGINIEKVKKKALEKGLITEEQVDSFSDKEAIDLLFRPGFSTADVTSDVSGRGVGLDVVKTKIEALGGDIEAKSVRGEGSSFTIRLPLTLAIIQALMVEIGKEKYAIPLGSIQTIEDVPITDTKTVQTKQVINLRGNVIPLISLDKVLDVPKEDDNKESYTVVIVRKGDKQVGLIVDDLIGQLEIVIKSIGKYINNSKMISGATILGDGEIALILDVNTLL